ncbi:hypothetical protein M408DRAFT_23041 [Serendipita vermifera MAFF 305830]|uniref:Uncharacterized protein n=1 Tax=Serendipita vermifera MAFF 305830 TaxID=933852 RepID=A0A0C3BAV5_SERVB|nr:hypothetical protein M408DRAFT_23041 [Serendipita vermifera MAFF 305830]
MTRTTKNQGSPLSDSVKRPSRSRQTLVKNYHSAVTEQRIDVTPTGLEADLPKRDRSEPGPSIAHTHKDHIQQSENGQASPFNASGELSQAPNRDRVEVAHSVALSQQISPKGARLKPGTQLKHAHVIHSPETQARIEALSPEEQLTVTLDGGNTVKSQIRVLEAIERLTRDEKGFRLWTEPSWTGPDGKQKPKYLCKFCDHKEKTRQRARQHFVSRHVDHRDVGWVCPVDGCDYTMKHKRLDDLKKHHVIPKHEANYYRERGPARNVVGQGASSTSSDLRHYGPDISSTRSSNALYGSTISTSIPEPVVDAPTQVPKHPWETSSRPDLVQNRQETGGTRIRDARFHASAGPSKLSQRSFSKRLEKRLATPSGPSPQSSGTDTHFGQPPFVFPDPSVAEDMNRVESHLHPHPHMPSQIQSFPVGDHYWPPKFDAVNQFRSYAGGSADGLNQMPALVVEPDSQGHRSSAYPFTGQNMGGLRPYTDPERDTLYMQMRDGLPGHDPPASIGPMLQGEREFGPNQAASTTGLTPASDRRFVNDTSHYQWRGSQTSVPYTTTNQMPKESSPYTGASPSNDMWFFH